ncbi:MAG: permease prefix domain 1-containing protein [Christensenellales bacterium]
MKDKLRNFIESLFEDAPKNKQTIELKEEMLQNLIDKYNDLVDSGKSSEAAYNIATASIGDIHELIRQIEKREENNPLFEQNYDKGRKRFCAFIIYISNVIYLMCRTCHSFRR